jgi:hypothetical protein
MSDVMAGFHDTPQARKKTKTLRPVTIFLVAASAILLLPIVLEFSLRLILPYQLLPPVFDYPPFYVQKNIQLRKGCDSVATCTFNQWGFRGPCRLFRYKKSIRIFLIGSSSTLCSDNSDTATWGYVLQQRLRRIEPRVDVYNAGMRGITTEVYAAILDKYILQLHPDAVVFLTGSTDLYENLHTQGRLQGNMWDNHFLRRTKPSSTGKWLLAHSRVAQVINVIKRWHNRDIDVRDNRAMNLPPDITDPLTPADSLPSDDSILVRFPRFKESVEKVMDLCRDRDVLPVFAFEPVTYSCDGGNKTLPMAKFRIGTRRFVLSTCKGAMLYERYEKSLSELCARHHVPLVDLNAILNHDPACFFDETHFTDYGNRIVGNLLADSIAPMLKGMQDRAATRR